MGESICLQGVFCPVLGQSNKLLLMPGCSAALGKSHKEDLMAQSQPRDLLPVQIDSTEKFSLPCLYPEERESERERVCVFCIYIHFYMYTEVVYIACIYTLPYTLYILIYFYILYMYTSIYILLCTMYILYIYIYTHTINNVFGRACPHDAGYDYMFILSRCSDSEVMYLILLRSRRVRQLPLT